jgi:pimeloyl-ACP methyl ester carboxylesterase
MPLGRVVEPADAGLARSRHERRRSMGMQKVTLHNSLGQRLVGCLHPCPGRGDLGPTVILCHGMMSSKDGRKQTALAEALAESGFAVLRFDFSFCGESGGRFEEITFSQEVDDLQCVVEWVRGKGAGPIGLVGSSMGAAVAILYAGKDPGVKALVALAAVARPGRLAEDIDGLRNKMAQWRAEGAEFGAEGEVGEQFFEDARRQDVLGVLERITTPILILHGAQDEAVPVEEAFALYEKASGQKRLKVLPESDHRFTRAEDLLEVIEATREWFRNHLGTQG